MEIKKKLWGTHDQQQIFLITISNGHIELALTNLGCTIVSIMVPDQQGRKLNMVLGYDSLQSYLNDPFYVGCIVGRFANRISNASFQIDNIKYTLVANEQARGNHLHGGVNGFNKKVFTIVDETSNKGSASIKFYYRSQDLEEGYPGNMEVYITYELTQNNEVIINYFATTDKATHVNLTNHSYFNLSGSAKPAIGHELCINANYMLLADERYIPTGEIKSIADTNYDFRQWRRIDNFLEQLPPEGCNVCFIFDKEAGNEEVKAGLCDPMSGRSMMVRTSLPSLMFYTGDYLQEPFQKNQGICLETQFSPDSPNRPEFPKTILYPGEEYCHHTIYHFIC
jgi:aldose 1-epimerase